jgi:hypothetical protein
MRSAPNLTTVRSKSPRRPARDANLESVEGEAPSFDVRAASTRAIDPQTVSEVIDANEANEHVPLAPSALGRLTPATFQVCFVTRAALEGARSVGMVG